MMNVSDDLGQNVVMAAGAAAAATADSPFNFTVSFFLMSVYLLCCQDIVITLFYC